MSDEYTVNLYFDKPLTKEQMDEVDKRLTRAYFKDSIDEDHTSLRDEQTPEEEKANIVPDFETAFKRYFEENGGIVEGNEDGTEAEAYFSGWECCRDAVKKEAKKIMKEVNQK